ncbi:STAS domain-containing protein [Legionella sp. D16C41]|uniref:STAS domain-containing protein n=1 Tax=Legionella sp. D16C41 TaxID=3402688 RepID=UPI003AF6AC47
MNSSSFIPGQNLTFSTIESERKRLLNYCRSNEEQMLCLNLKNVSLCDSAGLAFLIDFKRLARKYNKQSKIEGFTETILALAEFYGVDKILITNEID